MILYHVFVHPICHIPLFNFHKKKFKSIWKVILKFESGHSWIILL